MDLTVEEAVARLARSRTACARSRPPKAGGIYAWFVKETLALQPFAPKNGDLIYIGSAANLADREALQHKQPGSTPQSTLRRSLGAILKARLRLVAIPRSSNSADARRFTHYRFDQSGERKLTEWMEANLEVGFAECDNYQSIETVAIGSQHPLLCLTDWDNPDRDEIKKLRAQYAAEAEARAGSVNAGDLGNGRQRTISIDSVPEMDPRFVRALLGEDELGVVVRSHICVEARINAFLELVTPGPQHLAAIGLRYAQRVLLACALGLDANFKDALTCIIHDVKSGTSY